MSKYLLNKFLYTVDRDPELVERYRADPAGTVDWWEQHMANTCSTAPPRRSPPGSVSPRPNARRCVNTTT